MGIIMGPGVLTEPTPQIGEMRVKLDKITDNTCVITLSEYVLLIEPNSFDWLTRAQVPLNTIPSGMEEARLAIELPKVFREVNGSEEFKQIVSPEYFIKEAIILAFEGTEPQQYPGQSSGRGVLGESEFGVYQRKVYEIAERLRPGFREHVQQS